MFKSENEPKIHLHTTFAKKDMIKMGCIKDSAKVFPPIYILKL
jgi:predicted DNA-binding protein with PD1-like motif